MLCPECQKAYLVPIRGSDQEPEDLNFLHVGIEDTFSFVRHRNNYR